MYWSLLRPAIIHNDAPGVRSTEYRCILLLSFYNFIIFFSFHSSCISTIRPHRWFQQCKEFILTPFTPPPHKYSLNRVKPSFDVFMCNAGVVMRRNGGPSAAADRCWWLHKLSALSNKNIRYRVKPMLVTELNRC